MESDFAQLVSELKILRKGRGLFASKIGERVGPALREASGVDEGDGPAQIRRKVSEFIENLSYGLPEDLRMVLMAAFAIDRNVQMPKYWDRVRWVAEKTAAMNELFDVASMRESIASPNLPP